MNAYVNTIENDIIGSEWQLTHSDMNFKDLEELREFLLKKQMGYLAAYDIIPYYGNEGLNHECDVILSDLPGRNIQFIYKLEE